MASYTITLLDTDESYLCSEEQNLLAGMVRLGKRGIPVGCRGGGCGICKVEVMTGHIETKSMSRYHVDEEEEANGQVLACRAFPRSDVTLRVIGLMKKNICRYAAETMAV